MAEAFRLRAAAVTHRGRKRSQNEDCITVGGRIHNESMTAVAVSAHTLDAPCLCAVADGLGGHAAGEVASRYTIERLLALLPAAYPNAGAAGAALLQINRELFAQMRDEPLLQGMGTTVAGVLAGPDGAVVFNVGDSRVYRVSDDGIEQLSTDDVPQLWVPLFQVPPRTGILTQCLGGYFEADKLDPHVEREPVAAQQGYLLCSDGLYDMVDEADIQSSLGADLGVSVRSLLEKALVAGGLDNISIVLARIEPAGDS